mgnify:CR=1 FL=1
MELVDSHIHLQDYKTEDVNNIIKRAMKNGIGNFVNVSANPDDWGKIKAIAAQYRQIIPAYGVHPWHIAKAPNDWFEILQNILQENPQAWVGECGVDCVRNSDVKQQLEFFKKQVKLADLYNRPLIIHAVKALNVLNKMLTILPRKSIFHSFTGPAEWGKQIQNCGFFVGLNFSILRKKDIEQILHNLNITQILLETDGPYQNISVGMETMPYNLPILAEKLAKYFGLTKQQFINVLIENWLNFKGDVIK